MNLRSFFTVTILAAALPAFAAPTCNPPLVVSGNNCTEAVALGWGIAGLGTDSIMTIYVPPGASGPVDIEVTGLSSNLGSNYTGYFGIMADTPGQPGSAIVTLSDIIAGGASAIGSVSPGQLIISQITKVCWDPTCTAVAPSGAVPNMFSRQFSLTSPNPLDINPNDVQLTARFLNGSQVNVQEQEPALHTNSQYSIIPGINIGATPARFNGTSWTQPYDVLSVSNFANPNSISGTATLQDSSGNAVATAPIPAIPPNGAAGFLVVGRFSGDPIGLFPSSIVLPAGSDGIFHGSLIVGMTGQTSNGMTIVLSQEFNGNSMLNLYVFHSPVP
jgi:hypothetical protein